MNAKKIMTAASAASLAVVASAEVMDRPKGIEIGEHLTLRPYVSLSYTYDSNVDSTKHSKAGSQWVVNPGLGAEYLSENWKVSGAVWYQYHAYNRYSHQLNSSSYGEFLKLDWADSLPNERGWRVMFNERFQQISQDDDMSNDKGRGVGRDRKQFEANGVVERRLNEYWHADAEASYYLLDYDNDVKKYAPLYGWKRATAGGEIGFAPSPWTDFILAANYQWYWQDNGGRSGTTNIRSDSRGWTIMGGIATRATERIEYRVLGGWSRFKYADGADTINGWTYQVSGKWQISDTLNAMVLGSSYYQPSEYQYGTAIKVHTISGGLGKSFVRGKVTSSLDLAFRREAREYSVSSANDYDRDIWTARVGLNYVLNRFVTLFGRVEYQFSDTHGEKVGGHYYDYDRWRATVGMRLTY
jgi:hypothetical protein